MNRKPYSPIIRLLCPLIAAMPLVAQDAQVSGRVTDPSGAVVPKARIEIRNQATSASRSTSTNTDGFYVFPFLNPGIYTVSADADGFKRLEQTDVKLEVDQHAAVDLKLQVGATSEAVTVDGSGLLLNTADGSVGTVVDRQFVENMPLNGRSFQSLMALTPGVVLQAGLVGSAGEFSVNGQRTEANYYTVDGVAANTGSSTNNGAYGAGGTVPGETALGTTQSLVSLDALQEFRIQTSTYSAEYGRTSGGQISFVTRSGTNEWHGSASEYLRNSALDANNWFNNANRLPKTSERQNDFGATLGGPITIPHFYDGRNRTFFFFSYEGLRLSIPQAALTSFVPDRALRQGAPVGLQRYLNAFPVPNGPEILDASGQPTGMATFAAAYSSPGMLDSTAIRIDQHFDSNVILFARYSDAPSRTSTRSVSPVALSQVTANSSSIRVFTAGATELFSPRLVNQLRFNLTWNDGEANVKMDNFGGAIPFDVKNVTDANGQTTPGVDSIQMYLNFGGGALYRLSDSKSQQRQVNLVDSLRYSLNHHLLAFGIDYRRLTTPLTLPHLVEVGNFSSISQVLQDAPSVAQIQSQASFPIGPVYDNLSMFVQDEWKPTTRLSFSLGVRWELNPPPHDTYGNDPYTLTEVTNLAATALAPKGTPLWIVTYTNFAPRLGGAFRIRQTPGRETVIRAGFGVFYDTGNTYASQGYQGPGIGTVQVLNGTHFPFTSSALGSPLPSTLPPYNAIVYAFDPRLKLPYALQWSVAIEQALGRSQTLTINYVGSAGRRLLMQRSYRPALSGNPNFASTGSIYVVNNGATSDYDALQLQFQRRLFHGLQAFASYTWAHSIDDSSTNLITTDLLRANSNFDIRHSFQVAATYTLSSASSSSLYRVLLSRWSADTRVTGRTALPFEVIGGTFLDAAGTSQTIRANIVAGQPIYLSDPGAPGGRRVNYNAFQIPTAAQLAAGQFGSAPRNFLRGFDAWQVDLAVRREFSLHEHLKLQFRAEAFNLLNHPLFGAVRGTLTSGAALFGVATGTLNGQLSGLNSLYQTGGPRSIQLALKLVF